MAVAGVAGLKLWVVECLLYGRIAESLSSSRASQTKPTSSRPPHPLWGSPHLSRLADCEQSAAISCAAKRPCVCEVKSLDRVPWALLSSLVYYCHPCCCHP